MKRLLIIILLSFVSFWANNGTIYPDIMECRNLVTAREMVSENHWLVPTMNGELRLEKPPLPTWIAAAVETVSADNLSLQRGAAGLAGTLLVVFFYLIALRTMHSKRYATCASLILLTCYNFVFMGRTASWDIYCHAFMLGAVYYLLRALEQGARKPVWHLTLAGIFLGLSFLGKGPVSFYALLLPLLLTTLIFRPKLVWRGTTWGWVLLVLTATVLSSWWYIFIYVYHPEMSAAVMQKESTAWVNHNVRPWFYYWKFFLETGIWSLLCLTALAGWYWRKRVSHPRRYLFFLTWGVIALVLLSLLPEKKMRYLLPLLIPMSYTMGFAVHYWSNLKRWDKADTWLFRFNAGLIALVVSLLPVVLYVFLYDKGLMSWPMLTLCSLLICAPAFALWRSVVRLKAMTLVTAVLGVFLLIEVLLMPYVGLVANNRERRSIAALREVPALRDIPFYHNKQDGLRIELVYALYKRVTPIAVTQTDSLLPRLPMVVLTRKPAREELPADLWQVATVQDLGAFDDNPRPKTNRRYSPDFAYYVTLITAKDVK